MRDPLPRLIVVLALVAVIGLPFVLRAAGLGGAGAEDLPPSTALRLVVYTPHNEQIREEFAGAYNRDRVARGLGAVGFDWRASGGTSDLRRGILDQFAALLPAPGRPGDPKVALEQGIGADLLFGGGMYDHDKLVEGVAAADGSRWPVSVAPRLPAGLLEEAFPTPDIGGEPLLGPDNLWVGTALSSFGIVFNRDLLAMLGLPDPAEWDDLADPRYRGHVAMSDPGHSSSIAAALEAILRRKGWTDGWHGLRRVFANSRSFTASSTKVPMDVARGDAAAGICIDFYGRFQAGFAAGRSAGGGDTASVAHADIGYIDPVRDGKSQSVSSADPVTLLRGAPHRDTAEDFIAFVIRPEGQRLWQQRAGSDQGPRRFELRRLPVRRDFYRPEETRHWTDPDARPFASAVPVPDNVPAYFAVIAPVTHAMAVDHLALLSSAWDAIVATPADAPQRAAMLEAFDALPPELTLHWPDESLTEGAWWAAASDPRDPQHHAAAAAIEAFKTQLKGPGGDAAMRRQLAWSAFFKARYERVLELAGS